MKEPQYVTSSRSGRYAIQKKTPHQFADPSQTFFTLTRAWSKSQNQLN